MKSGAQWLSQLGPRLARLNVEVDLGSDEAVAYLRYRGGEAEAVTWELDGGAKIIMFRDREPTISAVLEEVAHVLQAVQRRFADEDVRIMSCKREVEAKECLIMYAHNLGIPASEDALTRRQLDEQQRELERLQEKWR